MSAHPNSVDLTDVDLITETVRTERLLLRPYHPEDAGPVFRACTDPESRRRLTLPDPYTRDDAAEWVTETTVSARVEKRSLITAVEADAEFVGPAGLHFPSTLLGPGIGYWSKEPRPQPSHCCSVGWPKAEASAGAQTSCAPALGRLRPERPPRMRRSRRGHRTR